MRLIFAIHILCIVIFIILRVRGRISAGTSLLLISALVPIFGPVCVIARQLNLGKDETNLEIAELNQMKIEDEIYRSIHIRPDQMAERILPLEESLLFSPPAGRRQLLLDVLSLTPSEYVPALRLAGQNDDTEVVHYAVTALVELRNDFGDRIEKMNRELEDRDSDLDLDADRILEYIQLEEEYIESGLPEKGELVESRQFYESLLKKRMKETGSAREKAELLKKRAENAMALRDYDCAGDLIDQLILMEPEREDAYLMRISCYSACRDRQGIDRTLSQLSAHHVFLTDKGRETVRFWQPDGVHI